MPGSHDEGECDPAGAGRLPGETGAVPGNQSGSGTGSFGSATSARDLPRRSQFALRGRPDDGELP